LELRRLKDVNDDDVYGHLERVLEAEDDLIGYLRLCAAAGMQQRAEVY
jgi:hypothetical protein